MLNSLTPQEQSLVAVNALVLFFFNYTGDDIAHLRNQSREFDHVWKEYVGNSSKETYSLLWELWNGKFGVNTKLLLLEYANERQGDFALRQVEMALAVRRTRQEGGQGQ